MHHRSARRLFAGPAAAIAAALVISTPAAAAAATALRIEIADATVPVGGQIEVDTTLRADREITVTGAAVSYELSGPAGVSLVSDDSSCQSFSPTQLECAQPFELEIGPDPRGGAFSVSLKADGGAEAGGTGTITATFTADGATRAVTEARVKVADDVDLAAGESSESSAEPGAAFDAVLEVTNTTTKVAHGAGVLAHTDYPFQAAEKFSNCAYEGDRLRGCVFEQDLDAGTAYRVVLPYRVRADAMAPGTVAGEFEWLTADDYNDKLTASPSGVAAAGAGGELRLEPALSAKRAPETDGNPENNWQSVSVTVSGKQGADVEAIGARVRGGVGDVVDAKVGLRNNGPASIDRNRSGESASVLLVTVPSGTKVATAPAGCRVAEWGKTEPNVTQYVCETGLLLTAGETVTWTFGLRIEKVQVDATGTVESNPACECSWFNKDIDRSNDRAKLIVNPSDEEPGEGAGGGTGDGDEGPGAGGGGGGLPITGPRGTAVALAGMLLVVAGFLGLVVARRRRTRFAA
jgi:hypothetical protein